MAIIFPTPSADGEIYTEASTNRQFIWSAASNRWSSHGGPSKVSLAKPLNPENGEEYYNSATNRLEVYNAASTLWAPIEGTAASSTGVDYLFSDVPYLLQSPTAFANQGGWGISAASNSGVTLNTGYTSPHPYGASSAYRFAANAYIELGRKPVVDVRGEFTFETLLYFDDSNTLERGLFYLGNLSSNTYRVQLTLLTTGVVRIYVQDGSTNYSADTDVLFVDNWYRIAFVKRCKALFIFVNGVLVSVQERADANWSAAPTPASDHVAFLGAARQGGFVRYAQGVYMDDIRLTNHTRYTGDYPMPTDFHTKISI